MKETFLYLLNVGCSATRSTLTKQNGKSGGTLPVFLFVHSLFSFVLFAVLTAIDGAFPVPAALWGAGYGALLALSTWAGTTALKKGPMGLTSAIASFSLVIPYLFGVAVWGERVSWIAILGVLLIFPAALAMNRKGQPASRTAPEPGWRICLLLTFLTNGFCSVVQKAQQSRTPGEGQVCFLLAAMTVCVAVYAPGFFSAVRRREDGRRESEKKNLRTALLYGCLTGIFQSLSSFLTLLMAGTQNSSVLFPILSVLTVVAALFCGRIFFGERLRPIQMAGVCAAIAAVICIRGC